MDSAPQAGWTGSEVKASFNAIPSVLYYTRAAHVLGLWKSELLVIGRFLPRPPSRLVEAGCGAGRVTLGLWKMGYSGIVAFDFAGELLDQARRLAAETGAGSIGFHCADATHVTGSDLGQEGAGGFDGALFMFNGLMQIPGRQNRRMALAGIRLLCAPGAPLIFTTHDRDASAAEREFWAHEARRWETGGQDPRLVEFGDRCFEDESGRVFMHLPDRAEVFLDLASAGWVHEFDSMRSDIAWEPKAVHEFADECRFWVARNAQ
jgi:SAM-dependent methyltransferase